MYRVVQGFTERFNQGHYYNRGDRYPGVDFVPPAGRADALCVGTVSSQNRTGRVYLVNETDETPTGNKSATGEPKKERRERPKGKDVTPWR